MDTMTWRRCCILGVAAALANNELPRICTASPLLSNGTSTTSGELISITSWHARMLTNVSWDIPARRQDNDHVIAIAWDEVTTASWLFGDKEGNISRADTPPSSTISSYVVPPIAGDELSYDSCSVLENAFNSSSRNAFFNVQQANGITVGLEDDTTWWYTASQSQAAAEELTNTSAVGSAMVFLSEPGLYLACLLLTSERCIAQDCVNITIYQPPYDFLEIESTNVGSLITVSFNLATRYAYSGDWAWVLGDIEPTFTLEDASSLTPSEAVELYGERCWFYFGRAIEKQEPFLCAQDPGSVLASFQSTPTLRAYQYGWFQMYIAVAGNESLWFAKRELYQYAMVENFYTCGITVQPLQSSTVTTTSDLVVTAVPEHGETCAVGDGIELEVRTGESSPQIEEVDAWVYFTGRAMSTSSEKTIMSIRLPYQGHHELRVSLPSGAAVDELNVTAMAADPYAPACDVTRAPTAVSAIGASISVTFNAKDFYANSISESWGDDAFDAWTFNLIENSSAAAVRDEGHGAYSVTSSPLEVSGTTFFFVERNRLGLPGSPFEVYVFGPDACRTVSVVGACDADLRRSIRQTWAANSPCKGVFSDRDPSDVACGYVPVTSPLGYTMIALSTIATLYVGWLLSWIRRHRRTVIVRLSQPFVCQLFLMGCILLNLTTPFHLGRPWDAACLLRSWILHVALTFTSGCLYMKTYRVHRIFNSAAKLSRISITDRQLVTWVLQLVAVDVVLLLIWTALDRPRKVDVTQSVSGVDIIDAECKGGLDFPVFSVILWTWKACLNIFGMVMAAKTWHCEDGVGESQPICLSVYNTTLVVLANLGIHLLVSNTPVKEGATSLTAAGGTIFTASVLFGPKVYRLWWHGDLAANPAERRGSTARTDTYGRRSSLTAEASGTGNAGGTIPAPRRSSSISMNLDFLKIGKILPISENPAEEEAAATVVSSQFRSSLTSSAREDVHPVG